MQHAATAEGYAVAGYLHVATALGQTLAGGAADQRSVTRAPLRPLPSPLSLRCPAPVSCCRCVVQCSVHTVTLTQTVSSPIALLVGGPSVIPATAEGKGRGRRGHTENETRQAVREENALVEGGAAESRAHTMDHWDKAAEA
jgi:hypothetical protein